MSEGMNSRGATLGFGAFILVVGLAVGLGRPVLAPLAPRSLLSPLLTPTTAPSLAARASPDPAPEITAAVSAVPGAVSPSFAAAVGADASNRATAAPRDGGAAATSSVAATDALDLPQASSNPLAADGAASDATTDSSRGGYSSAGVPILMYHYIRVNPVPSDLAGYSLSVTPADFASQMAYLASRGFTAVTMAQVRDYVRNGVPLPPRPVALTFDDGYADADSAARPILEENHFTATFYVITGFLDLPRYLSWNQVVALDREGMEIGSHTVHHPALTMLGLTLRHFEIAQPRADLERQLGHPVLDFCYPGGELNAAVEIGVARAGYLSATTTASGWARRGDDPLRLPRIRVWGGEPLREFASLLGQPFDPSTSARPAAAPVKPRTATAIPRATRSPVALGTRTPTPGPERTATPIEGSGRLR